MQGQNRFSVIIFLVVVLSILHSSMARRCYGTTVGESYEEMYCPWGYPLCVKFSNNFYGHDFRACGVENFCEIARDKLELTECYECNSDLCNASTKNMVSTITILTSGLITLFWSIQ
ncbi:uncharacterized protein LOC113003854 [Solenopsis invicta]|uniref:uncharacterized protein LOC113003854 n=1 Tax=Solenopsis invicta TaxID=13686 RepID=UPI00193D31FE|nr:uncharacterized protein LOC113003854 [Solenopsis invicta]